MPSEVFRDEFYSVSIDESIRVAEITRSDKAFESRAELLKTAEALLSSIEKSGANQFALVLDSRAAPSAKEGKYKDAFFTMARMLTSRFSKVAVVLQSQASIDKVKGDARPEVNFFTTVEDARAFVAAP